MSIEENFDGKNVERLESCKSVALSVAGANPCAYARRFRQQIARTAVRSTAINMAWHDKPSTGSHGVPWGS